MRENIFYYFVENITTKEQKMLTFDSYQGDIDEYIDYQNQLWRITDYSWEFYDLEDEMSMVY
jgi:hypothetical protein